MFTWKNLVWDFGLPGYRALFLALSTVHKFTTNVFFLIVIIMRKKKHNLCICCIDKWWNCKISSSTDYILSPFGERKRQSANPRKDCIDQRKTIRCTRNLVERIGSNIWTLLVRCTLHTAHTVQHKYSMFMHIWIRRSFARSIASYSSTQIHTRQVGNHF